MAKYGKFINKHFLNTKLEVFIHLDSEWLSYQDGEAQSYTVLMATPTKYDEESGILTMLSEDGRIFYLAEGVIEMFWEADNGFKLINTASSTLRPRKTNKKRDIM